MSPARITFIASIALCFLCFKTSTALNQVEFTGSLKYINHGDPPIADTQTNTFGMISARRNRMGPDTVNTGLFVSGPQHLKASSFKCDNGLNGNNGCASDGGQKQIRDLEFDSATCVTKNTHDDCAGKSEAHCPGFCSFAGGVCTKDAETYADIEGHVVGYYHRAGAVQCTGTNANYCTNWKDNAEVLHFDQADHCDKDRSAHDVVKLVLCSTEVDTVDHLTSGGDSNVKRLANAADVNPWKMDWCTTSKYSTNDAGSKPSDGLEFENFDIEDYDILDKQCFTISGSDRTEFDDVKCIPSTHQRDVAKSQSAAQRFMDSFATGAAADSFGLSRMRTGKKGVTADLLHGGSRYPDQEFCLVDPTLLRELFGCADDQREKCSDQTSCDNQCVDDGSGNPPDKGCVNTCECAGSLDSGLRQSHSDYLTGDWQTLQNKFYGDDTDSSHKCSHPEIMIANALSNYLDVADQDIRTACSQAKERFEAASRAYQVFVDPSKFDVRVNDQLQPNIYTVLREAWRQAEFTLRSSKIQEQTLDRIRKYQDYIEYQLANGKQGLKTDLIGTKGINDDVGLDGTIEDGTGSTAWSEDKTQSSAFRTFRTAFDQHVRDYIQLSRNENSNLRDDLDDAIAEINTAKEFAQELAATQISASTSLATVSVHFRKKLQLWMNIENTLEKSIGNAFDSEKQTESEHLMANMATHQVPIPGSISINSKEAEIAEGEAYNPNGSVDDREDENVLLDVTTELPADHITIIRMSNGKVVTSLDCNKCSVGDATDEAPCIAGGVCSHGDATDQASCEAGGSCDYSSFTTQAECEANGDTWAANTWVPNVWTGDDVCDVYDYKDELHPLQERDAQCEGQKCVLPAAEGSFQTMQTSDGEEQIIKDYKIDGAKYNREKPSSAGGGALVADAPVDAVNGVGDNNAAITVQTVDGHNKYFVNGNQQATIVLKRGDSMPACTGCGGHPLAVSTIPDGRQDGSPDVDETKKVSDVTTLSPGTYYYFCTAHSGMGGEVVINGGTSDLSWTGNIEGRQRRLCNLCQWK